MRKEWGTLNEMTDDSGCIFKKWCKSIKVYSILQVLCFCGFANPSASVNARRRAILYQLPWRHLPTHPWTVPIAAWEHALLDHHCTKAEIERRSHEFMEETNGGFIPHTPLVLLNQSWLASFYYIVWPSSVHSTWLPVCSAAESKWAQIQELGKEV